MIDFSTVRRDFPTDQVFLEPHLFGNNPLEECEKWLKIVQEKSILDGNAMTLSTSSKDGEVTSRIVLLKFLDSNGFKFFTNYNSQKGKDLLDNPKASLLFYWPMLNRQICIRGLVSKLDPKESDKYFDNRPKLNQLLALASNQDEVIDSTRDILDKVEELQLEYKDKIVKRPLHWGGFCLKPNHIEFWQGAKGRINQRILYYLKNSQWIKSALSP